MQYTEKKGNTKIHAKREEPTAKTLEKLNPNRIYLTKRKRMKNLITLVFVFLAQIVKLSGLFGRWYYKLGRFPFGSETDRALHRNIRKRVTQKSWVRNTISCSQDFGRNVQIV